MLAALGLLATPGAQAQTVQFSAAQTVIPSSSLNYPYRVAVDALGNVYISDTQQNSVLMEHWQPR